MHFHTTRINEVEFLFRQHEFSSSFCELNVFFFANFYFITIIVAIVVVVKFTIIQFFATNFFSEQKKTLSLRSIHYYATPKKKCIGSIRNRL